MADNVNQVISVIVCNSEKISDIEIKDKQIIFIHDKGYLAVDAKGTRKFYNQIKILEKDNDRINEEPENGSFYFVIGTSVLWFYQNGWTQLTSSPDNYVFIDVSLPELGKENILYVNKQKKNISVWDEELQSYIIVGEQNEFATNDDILGLFQN